jgi:hypothetical protein
MLHELEIAAQITDWDIDETTSDHPRLVTPPSARSARDVQHNFKQDNRRHTLPTQRARPRSNAGPTTTPPSTRAMPIEKRDPRGNDHRRLPSEPTTTTLSQELAIAAEIPWWDFEDDQREEQTPSCQCRWSVISASLLTRCCRLPSLNRIQIKQAPSQPSTTNIF